MSLYADYLKERTSLEVIEEPYGFVTYYLNGNECYLQDIYIIPSERKNHKARSLADRVSEIAKEKGCTILVGSVSVLAKNPEASLLVLISYGMKLHSLANDLIIFKKELI